MGYSKFFIFPHCGNNSKYSISHCAYPMMMLPSINVLLKFDGPFLGERFVQEGLGFGQMISTSFMEPFPNSKLNGKSSIFLVDILVVQEMTIIFKPNFLTVLFPRLFE